MSSIVPVGSTATRGRDRQSGRRRRRAIKEFDRGLETGLERRGQVDNLTTERLERIAVAGVAGRRDDDPITDIERGEERSNERTRRADGEHQPIGIHLDAVPLVVVASDTGTELRRARSGRIPRTSSSSAR